MALLSWTDPFDFARPSRILDQYLGMEPEDYIAPLMPGELRSLLHRPSWMPVHQDASVSWDKDKFQANLDVQQFRPDEITVKVSEKDHTVTVEGKHEEKRDEHGFISRHFVRRYVLPEGHDLKKVESKLSSDGVLTIQAPKSGSEGREGERSVPVVQTGQPKVVEDKKNKKRGFLPSCLTRFTSKSS